MNSSAFLVRAAAVAAALTLLCLTSCGEPEIDLEELVDRRVDEEWMQPGMYVDAGPFFEEGGHYYDHPEMEDRPQLDEQHIIPLLTELREEFDLPQYVVLDDQTPGVAWAVVMKLPPGSGARQALHEFLDNADKQFPGMILQEWGQEWLSIDFLNEEEEKFVRAGWGLDAQE